MRRLKAYSVNIVVLVFVFFIVLGIGTVNTTSKIRDKEMKNTFRNIYTIYSENLQKTVLELAGETGCYYSTTGEADVSGCDAFYSTFVKNMKVKKYCQNNGFANKCVPLYGSYTTDKVCYGFSEEVINKYDDVFVMENGSNIIIFNTKAGKRAPIFAVDVNGMKGPNKAGEDLFTMLVIKNVNNSYYFHSNVTYCLPVTNTGIKYIQDVYK